MPDHLWEKLHRHKTMRIPTMLKILSILDDAKCYAKVRELCWPHGVVCPCRDSPEVVKMVTMKRITIGSAIHAKNVTNALTI